MKTSKKFIAAPLKLAKRVLGIDPGYDRLGVAVIENNKLLYSDCLTSEKQADLSERYRSLGTQLEQIITAYQPTHLALEKLFFARNQKTASAVAEIRGVIRYLAAKAGLALSEYTPSEIKLTITGYGQADKKQVIAMVQKLIPAPRGRPDDEYDAIAVALTALAKI